jgi:protein-S-isoprenylcysteine O-methyltransferase Ste14
MAVGEGVRKSIDVGERIFVVLLSIPFLLSFATALPTHPNIVLTAISEMLTVTLILARRPGEISVAPMAVLVAFAGAALPLLVRPGGVDLVPTLVSSTLMTCGLALSVTSKLYLNRSFGLVAANRGVKVGGPYRLVRHPMYLGYIITQSGFLLGNFDWMNLAIYSAAWTFQVLRVREEESVLRQDPAYQDFACQVSSRLIPRVY